MNSDFNALLIIIFSDSLLTGGLQSIAERDLVATTQRKEILDIFLVIQKATCLSCVFTLEKNAYKYINANISH